MTMRYSRCLIIRLHTDNIFLAICFFCPAQPLVKCKILFSHSHMGMYNDIILPDIRMQRCRAFCHGSFHCHNRFIHLILNLHKPGRPRSSDLVFCDDSRNIIPIDTHPLIQNTAVAYISVLFLHAPRMPCRRKLTIRHIKAGHNLNDARNT